MNAPLFAKSLLAFAVACGSIAGAHAASQIFYADQLSAVTPEEARNAFLQGASGVALEGFETQPTGFPLTPLSILLGQGSLIQNDLANGTVKQGAQQNGRFNTTPGACNVTTTCKWWETPNSFAITLTSLKSAFGFFATDLGDLGGAVNLDFWNDANKVRSGIAVTQATPTSGLVFFGYIDDTFSFNRVSFNVTQTNANPSRFDYIGFDDVLVGTRAAVDPVPPSSPVSAPASLALVGLSLGLLAATRRRTPDNA